MGGNLPGRLRQNDSRRRPLRRDPAEPIARILESFESKWDVSLGERVDGSYSIHFLSRDEYERFCKEALAVAAPYYAFEGDVLDLLRPEAEYDDLVALIWEPAFDIRSTLAKVLKLREMSEAPILPNLHSLLSTRTPEGSTPHKGAWRHQKS